MSFFTGMLGFMRFTGIPTNYNPVVDILTANNTVFNEGDLITFDASAVDLDGVIVSAVWAINGVDVETEADPTALQYQTNQLTAGSYTVSITVTDDEGATTSDSISFVVQSVSSVAGLGEHEAMSSPYISNETSQATGIRIDGLIFDQDPDGMQAPDSFLVVPIVSVAGTNSDGTAIEEEDYQVHWVLTDADDNTLAYDDIVIDAKNGGYKDYNKALGPVGYIPNDFAGDMKLTVKVSVASSTMGMMWSDTYVHEYTTIDHAGDREYYDATNGSSGNDGLDGIGHLLFNGSGGGLTNASYTESTGYLTQTGAFEGVALTNEARPYCSNRWMYLDGAYVELAEIIDNDTARIADKYKLGANTTGLTSSSGAKDSGSFAARRLYNSANNDHMLFLSGMNSDVYTKTNSMYIRGVNGHTGVVGYGGRATLRSSDTSEPVLYGHASSSSYINFEHCYVGDLIIDGEDAHSPVWLNNQSNSQTRNRITFDNVDLINNEQGTSLLSSASGFSKDGTDADKKKDIHVYMRGGLLDNKWNNEHTYTIDTATSGAGTFTVNETIDADVLQHSLIRIVDGGTTHYYLSDTWTGSEFTLKVGRGEDPPEYLRQTYSSGATVTTWNPKTITLFGFFTHMAVRGVTFRGDGAETYYDHLAYQSFQTARSESEEPMHHFCDNLAKSGSRRLNYFSNLNNDSKTNLRHFNESENFAEAGSCIGMLDASGGTNSVKDGTFSGLYRYGNKALNCTYPIYTFTGLRVGYYDNEFATDTPTDRAAINFGEGGTNSSQDSPNDHLTQNEYWPDYVWSWKIQRTKAYNYRAMITRNSNERNNPDLFNKYQQGSLSYVGNDIYYMGTEPVVEIGKDNAYANDGTLTVTGNNIYAPNALYEVDGVSMSLSAFNTLVGGANTEVIQAWNDPVNGDFSTEASPQVLTYDPAKPIYQTITDSNQSTAYYTQGGQYRFETTAELVSSDSDQYFFNGASSGGYYASYAFAWIDSNGLLQLFNCPNATIDGVSYTDGSDVSAFLDDGLQHDVSITIQSNKRIGAVGIDNSGSAGFAGKMYNIALVNNGDDVVIANFAMDEIKLDGDTEISNGIVMTHHNTTGADWSSR